MTTRVLTAAMAALLGGVIAGCGGAEATDVVDVSVVTTLPKEVGPGGFDRTIAVNGVASGYFFKATLSDCGQVVDSVAGAWAAQHGLLAGTRTVDPRSVTLEFTSQTPGMRAGSFTVLYSRGAASADVRVTFRGTDGAQPLTSADLGQLGMETLVDGLLGAARCDGAPAS